MTTDIIVVNYRTPSDLARFIDSYRDTVEDGNLIVMDVDPISPFGYKNVPGYYIVATKNLGYAYACNTASVLAKGDVLSFFNADVVLKPGTVEKTAQALREHPEWGVAGPLQYSSDGHVTHAGIFGSHAKPRHRAWRQRVTNEFRDVREAVTVSGSAYFVKRECWDELSQCPIWTGMFPDNIGAFLPTFLYYEETALSYHAHAHGWKVMYYGEAECIHEWHGSIKKHTDQGCVGESRALFRMFCDSHNIPRD